MKQKVRLRVLKQLAWAKHIKATTPILQLVPDSKGEHYWQLGTPDKFKHEVGVFQAQNCQQANGHIAGDFSAFKGVSQVTQLQDNTFTFPHLYQALLTENSRVFRMSSFHYNMALAYSKQSDTNTTTQQSRYWLKLAESWEYDVARRKN